jgi:hypothetical protein
VEKRFDNNARVRRFGKGEGAAMPDKSSEQEPLHEYHLLDFKKGVSHGGFASLEAARAVARELGLASWQIFHGDTRVEHHDPEVP